MYLARLNEQERKNFLNLAYYTANVDEDFSIAEENLIDDYRKEMELFDYEPEKIEFEEGIEFFADKAEEKKNIIFIETFALVMADANYEKKEKDLINKMQQKFGFSDEKTDQLCQWVKDVIDIYAREIGRASCRERVYTKV
mgnify:CR=1 FL=1